FGYLWLPCQVNNLCIEKIRNISIQTGFDVSDSREQAIPQLTKRSGTPLSKRQRRIMKTTLKSILLCATTAALMLPAMAQTSQSINDRKEKQDDRREAAAGQREAGPACSRADALEAKAADRQPGESHAHRIRQETETGHPQEQLDHDLCFHARVSVGGDPVALVTQPLVVLEL